jgi:lysophospholipase L1-like esterase
MQPKTLIRLLLVAALVAPGLARAQGSQKWVTSWTGAVQGPYPVGNPSAQPNLNAVFPTPADGARDQTFRLIIRPDIWGSRTRLRISNVFGTKPITFDGVFAGLRATGGTIVPNTNRPVLFAGKPSVTVAAGQSVWSDAVALPFVRGPADPMMVGRKLAVSFHVDGETGPMTWHAKALTTSYVTAPGAGSKGRADDDAAFPFSTASWYFLDAVDMMAPASTRLVVAFGDSITDGTDSTLNGDDRWPNVLSYRLHAAYGPGVAVVNEGIGGDRIIGPKVYTAAQPFSGGPAALQRMDRDVLALSGVSAVVFLEGTNDFGKSGEGATQEDVQAGVKAFVTRLRDQIKHVRIIGATLPPNLTSTNPDHGSAVEDALCRAYNDFIRTTKLFDGYVDFYKVTVDPQTGVMKTVFIPDSTIGGTGDKLHPNRAGYKAMAEAIDLPSLMSH